MQGPTYVHSHTRAHTCPKPPNPATCTGTVQCLQQTPWPLLSCFPPKALGGIEATSPWSSPVCVCSCRTCPGHARLACISCSSESAAGTWAAKAARAQRRVKKLPHSSLWGLWLILERMSEGGGVKGQRMCEESVSATSHTPPSLPLSLTWALTHECCDTHTCIDTLKFTCAMHGKKKKKNAWRQ